MMFHHPRILDLKCVSQDGDVHFQIMEFLPDGTLGDLLRRTGVLPEATALRLVAEVAEALDLIHAAGLVHRDVSASSIFLTQEGRAVLGRFGLVLNKIRGQDLIDLWNGFGTAAYMSPQQMDDPQQVEPTDDIYSLGVLLLKCLVQWDPFPARSLAEIRQSKGRGLGDWPVGSPIRPEIQELIRDCLSPDRAQRPQTAASVAEKIATVLGKGPHDLWLEKPKYVAASNGKEARWYLLLNGRGGGIHLRKTTRAWIVQGLLRGVIGGEALAAKSLSAPFRPIHQIREFETVWER